MPANSSPRTPAIGSSSSTATVRSHALFLAASEIGLGSLLHALHVPFAGTVLSLHQILILSLIHREDPRWRTSLRVSAFAGVMKLGLGQGKRLTPMIAIACQGGLFALGVALRSRALGAALAALWGILQPVLALLVITAGEGLTIFHFYNSWAEKHFLALTDLVLAVAAIKMLAAVAISRWVHSYPLWLGKSRRPLPTLKTATHGSLQRWVLWQLGRPFYLLSLAAIGFFYWQDATTWSEFAVRWGRAIGLTLGLITASGWLFRWSQRRWPEAFKEFQGTPIAKGNPPTTEPCYAKDGPDLRDRPVPFRVH